MTTFKEFLLNRNVINENIKTDWVNAEKNPKNKALKAFADKYNSPVGLDLDDKQKEKYRKQLNKLVAQNGGKNDFESWDKVIEAWNEYQEKKDAYDTDNSDISDLGEDKRIEYLVKALKNERITSAVTINKETAKYIAEAFIRADNKDGNINKDEFTKAIKLIKKEASKNNEFNNPANIASLLYFVYLVKVVKKINGQKIVTTKTDGINRNGIERKGIDDKKVEKLNKRLEYFTKLKFDSKVLSIFAKPSETIAFIKSTNPEDDKKQLEKINDSFGDKKVDETEGSEAKGRKKGKGDNSPADPQAEKAKRDVDATEIALNNTQERKNELEREKKDLLSNSTTPREDAVSKKKFYIFDIDAPESSDNVGEWFEKMRDPKFDGGAMGLIQKIKDELKSYAPKPNDNDLNEMIAKVFKKNGIILEDYEKTSSKIRELIKNSEEKINKYLDGAQAKAKTLQLDIEESHDYKETIGLRRKFKQLFIDLGYVLSQEIRSLVRATDFKMDSLKNDKRREEIHNHKTTEQLGQERIDSSKIVSIMDGNGVDKDEGHIARFMLINLLNNNKSSDGAFEFLKAKNFGANKTSGNDRAYVYSGDSDMLFALNAKGVTEIKKDNNIFVYKFNESQARAYRNPAALLKEAVGIDIEKLTPGVLKAVKKEINNKNIEAAERYLNFANELYDKIRQTKQQSASVVAEEKVEDYLSSIEKHSHKIELGKAEPMGDNPESIALRQILKGGCLVKTPNNEYFIAMEDPTIAAEKEVSPQQQQSTQPQPSGQNPDSAPIDWNNWDYSVVTSTNADSTYGDGYGYSKKADAIKKKLNSTTYTYMPNSKMRIVRRTFD